MWALQSQLTELTLTGAPFEQTCTDRWIDKCNFVQVVEISDVCFTLMRESSAEEI